MEKRIKYSYCVDKDNRLVHISELTNETRHCQTWRCLQCGQEMTPNLGEKKSWYFSHKANTACDGESYLHQLAKRKIREKFLSSDSFTITFVRDVPCNQRETCLYYNDYNCQKKNVHIPCDLKKWKGRILYDSCQEEVKVGEFRPDLILTNSKLPDREPIFIEINVTHQSEEKKLKSKYRIIETMRIKSEDDIEDIINRGFVESIDEGGNCEIYNFDKDKLELPSVKINNAPIERFVFYGVGVAYTFKTSCDQLSEQIIPNSAYELNIGIKLLEKNTFHGTLDFYELGLIFLIKKKGLRIKNCISCKFKFHDTQSCTFRKFAYQLSYQTIAKICPRYQIDQEKIDKYPLSELEKIISEVPMQSDNESFC